MAGGDEDKWEDKWKETRCQNAVFSKVTKFMGIDDSENANDCLKAVIGHNIQ